MAPRRNPAGTGLWAVALLAGAVSSGCVSAESSPRFLGPMPVRNQHPVQATTLHFAPQPTVALSAGEMEHRVNAAYTSLFLGQAANGRSWRMDGEVLRTTYAHGVGLGGGFEALVEFGAAHTTGGFLDTFVEAWHDTFGLPDQGRQNTPRGEFDVRGFQNDAEVYSLREETARLLDTPVILQWHALQPGPYGGTGILLRAGVEIPTGDDKRGFGNGGFDVGVGAGVSQRWPLAELSLQVSHSFVHTPAQAREAGLEFRDVTSLAAALEVPLGSSAAALVQTEWETSTLRGLGIDRTADPQWLLWTGLRVQVADGWDFEFGLGEDLSPFIAPDFTAWFGLRYGPSRTGQP